MSERPLASPHRQKLFIAIKRGEACASPFWSLQPTSRLVLAQYATARRALRGGKREFGAGRIVADHAGSVGAEAALASGTNGDWSGDRAVTVGVTRVGAARRFRGDRNRAGQDIKVVAALLLGCQHAVNQFSIVATDRSGSGGSDL